MQTSAISSLKSPDFTLSSLKDDLAINTNNSLWAFLEERQRTSVIAILKS